MTSKMKPKDRILQWARPEIVALKPYQSAREEFVNDGREMILLDANENPFNNGMNRYPDPMQKKLKATPCGSKKRNRRTNLFRERKR